MPRFSLEDVDGWMDAAEVATAITSLGATGATVVAPNPVTGAIAVGSNLAGAGIDLYQGIRAAINGDYGGATKNAVELLLSIVGAKAMSSADKLYKADKALNAAGATRNTVTRTIGRGRARHKITMPVEIDKANTMSALGFSSSVGGIASSIGGAANSIGGRRYIAPTDNTRMANVQPVTIIHASPKSK